MKFIKLFIPLFLFSAFFLIPTSVIHSFGEVGGDITIITGINITTTAATNITSTTATAGGNISSDGGSAITARGTVWSTSENPTTANSTTTDGTGTSTFSSSLTLTPNTFYYYRAYAINSKETAYGEPLYITTPTPTVTVTASPTIYNTIPSGPVTVRFTSTTNPGNTQCVLLNNAKNEEITPWAGSNPTSISFTASATPNSYGYFVRCINATYPGTPGDSEITVNVNAAPTVDTPTATNITSTTATLGATVRNLGYPTPISALGVCVGTSENPTTGCTTGTLSQTVPNIFTVNVGSLTPRTTYHYRGYATNATGIGYTTSDASFTTLTSAVTPTAPTVTTAPVAVPSITQTTAVGGGSVTSNGGSPVIRAGIVWHVSDPSTSSYIGITQHDNWANYDAWSDDMTGLACGTTYNVRAYATNSAFPSVIDSTSYGAIVSFKTLACTTVPTAPTVDTPTATNITSTTATLGATVRNLGYPTPISALGVCVGTSENPTTGCTTGTLSQTVPNIFTVNITGLTSGTVYHYRGYATNATGIGYTIDATFTTSTPAAKAVIEYLSVSPSPVQLGQKTTISYLCTNEAWSQLVLDWTFSKDGGWDQSGLLSSTTPPITIPANKLPLGSHTLSAYCVNSDGIPSDNSWYSINFEVVSASSMTGTLISDITSCTIPLNANVCSTNPSLDWTITNPIGDTTAITADGLTDDVNVMTSLADPKSGTKSAGIYVSYPSRLFHLYNNEVDLVIPPVTVTSSCASGSWIAGATPTVGAILTAGAGACKATISVTATTPIAVTPPGATINFTYVAVTSPGSYACQLLDFNSDPLLTNYVVGGTTISYASVATAGQYLYYIKCKNTTYPDVTAISNKITVNVTATPTVTATLNINDNWAYGAFQHYDISTFWNNAQVQLNWSSTGATSCNITDKGVATSFTAGAISGTTSIGTIDLKGISHTYVLSCVNSDYTATDTRILTVPATPTNVAFNNTTCTGNTLTLGWNQNSAYGEASYYIREDENGTVTYYSDSQIVTVSDSSGSVTFTTVPGRTYNAGVEARYETQPSSPYSKMVNPTPVTCPALSSMTGTLTSDVTSCTIPLNANVCSTNPTLTWSITNPIGDTTAITATGLTDNVNVMTALTDPKSGTKSAGVYVSYSSRLFHLYNNEVDLVIPPVNVTSSCASGSWIADATPTVGAILTAGAGACKDVSDVTTVNTPTATNITSTTATLGANVASLGIPASISERGVVYSSTTSNPTTANTKAIAAGTPGLGVYTVDVTGLTPETLYHYRGYAIHSSNSYSSNSYYTSDAIFTTLPSTVTVTVTVSPTTYNTIPSGTVNVLFTSTTNPGNTQCELLDYEKTVQIKPWAGSNPTSISFTASATPNSYGYFVRCRNATDQGITGDSEKVTVNVNTPPTVDTPTATAITKTTATLGATVKTLGYPASISALGVCYRTSANPTAPCKPATLSQNIFTVNVDSLTPGTTYHYRGYARNSSNSYTTDATFGTMDGKLLPSPTTCIIPINSHGCNATTLTWTTTNPVATESAVTASFIPVGTKNYPAVNVSSGTGDGTDSTSFLVPHGSRIFYLYNNEVQLATSEVTGICATGTTWDDAATPTVGPITRAGAVGACTGTDPNLMTGSITPIAPTCTIALNANNCDVSLSWSTINPVVANGTQITTSYPSANTPIGTAANLGGPVDAYVGSYNSRTFTLYNNEALLNTQTATSSCIDGTKWDPSATATVKVVAEIGTKGACVTPITPNPTGNIHATWCGISSGSYNCDSTLDWDTTNAGSTTSVVKLNDSPTPIATKNSQALPPGFTKSIDYGDNIFNLWNDTHRLSSVTAKAYCSQVPIRTNWCSNICSPTPTDLYCLDNEIVVSDVCQPCPEGTVANHETNECVPTGGDCPPPTTYRVPFTGGCEIPKQCVLPEIYVPFYNRCDPAKVTCPIPPDTFKTVLDVNSNTCILPENCKPKPPKKIVIVNGHEECRSNKIFIYSEN